MCIRREEDGRRERLTNGVRTGTVRRWYLVCTTGALIPGTVSGRLWKSLARRRCAGKYLWRMSKNCMRRVGMYSGTVRLAASGSRDLKARSSLDERRGCL